MDPQRPFRDDVGAAVERAARLEAENVELRAELERLQGGPAATASDPPGRLGPVGMLVVVLVALGLSLFLAIALVRVPERGSLQEAPPGASP